MSRFDIYKIFTYGAASGSHAIQRDEIWTIKKIASFEAKEEAERFVRQATLDLPEFKILAEGIDRDTFVEEFVSGERYLAKNRYFMGYPPIDRIAAKLRSDGVQVRREVID